MDNLTVKLRVANELIQKEHGYTFNSGTYEVKPFKITRYPMGDVGAARNRYYYRAHFIGFGDMLNIHKESLAGKESRENINRKLNPKFKPQKLKWVDNVALCNQDLYVS